MARDQSFDPLWETLYSSSDGKHLNKYPYGVLVSVFFQNLKHIKTESIKYNVLEVGCGVGNNLPVFLNEGFECYGIDGSPSVIEIAQKRLSNWNKSLHLDVGDLVNLPYSSNFFDIVVDRQAIYANTKENIGIIFDEVSRILKPGGIFISFLYNTNDYHMDMIRSDEGFAEAIEENTYTNFKGGTFEGAGITHFFTCEEILDLCSDRLEVISLSESRKDAIYPKNYNELAEFILIARKM